MAHYDYYREQLVCDCGHTTNNYIYSELVDDLDKYNDEIEDTVEMSCKNCNRKYEIDLELKMEIQVIRNKVQLKSFTFKDKDFNDFDSSLLDDKFTGDIVGLEDGQYTNGINTYYVENSKIIYIVASNISENQLKLDL